MNSNSIEVLWDLSRFLEHEAVLSVPDDLRSDMRAAAKILADMASEFDQLPSLLLEEIEVMLSLIEEAAALSSVALARILPKWNAESYRKKIRKPFSGMKDVLDVHSALLKDAETVLVKLQTLMRDRSSSESEDENILELTVRFYRALGSQAIARLSWQSVFPKIQTP